MRILLYQDNKQLEESVDYTLDWNSMELRVLHSNPYSTYRVLIYANMTKFQDEFRIFADLEKRDKTYADLQNPIVEHDLWRDRENQILNDVNTNYFMPLSSTQPKYSSYNNNRDDIEYKG